MEKVVPDGERLLRGVPFPVKRTTKGIAFAPEWSEYIAWHGNTVQVAKVCGDKLVAMKFQPQSRLMLFFPAGAIIWVLEGRIVVADRSTDMGGHRLFEDPKYLLVGYDMKEIDVSTFVNLVSDDLETTLIIFQPKPFEVPSKK